MDIEQRLCVLSRRVRALTLINTTLGLALVLILTVGAAGARSSDVVRTQRLQIVDYLGNEVGSWDARFGVSGIFIGAPDSPFVLSLTATNGTASVKIQEDGEVRSILTPSGLTISGEGDATGVAVSEKGVAVFEPGEPRVVLGPGDGKPDNQPYGLFLTDPATESTAAAFSASAGSTSLWLSEGNGASPGVLLSASEANDDRPAFSGVSVDSDALSSIGFVSLNGAPPDLVTWDESGVARPVPLSSPAAADSPASPDPSGVR